MSKVPPKHELIFERWRSALDGLDKKGRDKVYNIFSDLFYDFKRSQVNFEDAYSYIDSAAKALYPKKTLVNHLYKEVKKYSEGDITEREYVESWRQWIDNQCKLAFFEHYEIDGTAPSTISIDREASAAFEYAKKNYEIFDPYAIDLGAISDEDVSDLEEILFKDRKKDNDKR
jgi:hypothetical protein